MNFARQEKFSDISKPFSKLFFIVFQLIIFVFFYFIIYIIYFTLFNPGVIFTDTKGKEFSEMNTRLNASYHRSTAPAGHTGAGRGLGSFSFGHNGARKTEPGTKPAVRAEAALCGVVLVNSMGVALITHSGLGISAISSVPYALTCIVPAISQGTWTICFQLVLILTLMVLQKRLVPSYFVSILVGCAFSFCLDCHELWVSALPNGILANAVCFFIGYLCICCGVAVSNLCRLPIIPTDMFPREFSLLTGISYSRVKTTFDVICLLATAVLTLVFLGSIRGLGIGTVISALTMGRVIHAITEEISHRVRFV